MHFFHIGAVLMALEVTGVAATHAFGRRADNTTATPKKDEPGDSRTIVAYTDGICEKPLGKGVKGEFKITDDFPHATTFPAQDFPGAEAKAGGGYEVWFSIKQPEPTCRQIIMIPFNQDRPTPELPVGKEIVNAGAAGCYFARIPKDKRIMMSTCCGDACNKASLDSASLIASPAKSGQKLRRAAPIDTNYVIEEIDPREATLDEQATGSVAARANSMMKRFLYKPPPAADKCTFLKDQPFSQAGKQIVVSGFQACADSPCQIQVSKQATYSTTATFSQTQTLTTSFGTGLSIEAGVDFIASAKMTAEVHAEISNAIATATGQDVMNGNTTTITNSISMKLGNLGAVTFTPIYKCWTGPFDCGHGKSDPTTVCQPDMVNGQINGEFEPIVIG